MNPKKLADAMKIFSENAPYCNVDPWGRIQVFVEKKRIPHESEKLLESMGWLSLPDGEGGYMYELGEDKFMDGDDL